MAIQKDKGLIEKSLLENHTFIAGTDEVGRGCLAGPVYAAATVLDYEKLDKLTAKQKKLIRDSKTLSKKQREDCVSWLPDLCVDYGIGFAEVAEIETLGILKASFLAMQRALQKLRVKIEFLLIDGKQNLPGLKTPQQAVVKGDSLCFCIAAASIFAKEARDGFMLEQSKIYPHYSFQDHVGYGTKKHQEALECFGITPLHRRNYAPIRNLMSVNKSPQ